MRSTHVFHAVDSHTEGMPTRVVTGGVGTLPGDTMAERRELFMRDRDDLRTLLMYEPRGHAAMSGAILQPPSRPDADLGVVYIEVTGCLPMCGHGTIGVATVAVETGLVEVTEPITTIRLDTPAGLVVASVEVEDGAAVGVTIANVPSFLAARDATIDAGGDVGEVTVDVSYGGNFYAIVPAGDVGLELGPGTDQEAIRKGLLIARAADRQLGLQHPDDPRICHVHHTIFTAPGGILTAPDGDGASSRGATIIEPGWVDRSPCGTGTSARMAQLHARGELGLDEDFVHESPFIGSRFLGRLTSETTVGDLPAVTPTIRGRAWVTGIGTYLLDPTDPFPAGFLLNQGRPDAPTSPSASDPS